MDQKCGQIWEEQPGSHPDHKRGLNKRNGEYYYWNQHLLDLAEVTFHVNSDAACYPERSTEQKKQRAVATPHAGQRCDPFHATKYTANPGKLAATVGAKGGITTTPKMMWLTLRPLTRDPGRFVTVAISSTRAAALRRGAPGYGVVPWAAPLPAIGQYAPLRVSRSHLTQRECWTPKPEHVIPAVKSSI